MAVTRFHIDGIARGRGPTDGHLRAARRELLVVDEEVELAPVDAEFDPVAREFVMRVQKKAAKYIW